MKKWTILIIILIFNLAFQITALGVEPSLQRGDIFISTNNTFKANLIKLFTGQKFFHAGIILNPSTGWIVHSTPDGTEFTHKDIKAMVNNGKMQVLRYKGDFTPKDRIELLNMALNTNATYTWKDIIKIAIHKLSFGTLYKEIEGITCIALVGSIFTKLGKPINDGANDFMTVANFLTSPKLEVVHGIN